MTSFLSINSVKSSLRKIVLYVVIKKKCFAHFQDCIENGERWETLRNIAQKDHLLASYIKKSLLYCLESIKKVLAPSSLLSIAKTLVPCSPWTACPYWMKIFMGVPTFWIGMQSCVCDLHLCNRLEQHGAMLNFFMHFSMTSLSKATANEPNVTE